MNSPAIIDKLEITLMVQPQLVVGGDSILLAPGVEPNTSEPLKHLLCASVALTEAVNERHFPASPQVIRVRQDKPLPAGQGGVIYPLDLH